jgi:hypothetical protein
MSRAAFLFPALVCVVTAVLVGYAAANYTWTALVFPLGIGIMLCGLCVAEATLALAAAAREPAPDIEAVEPLLAEPLSLSSIGWIFALIAFLYAFGFVVGPALYLFAFLRVNGFAWSTATAIGLASVAVTWGFFIKTVGILLPVAPLWM